MKRWAFIIFLVCLVCGCGRREIGMLGFTVGEYVECSDDGRKSIGVRSVTTRADGLQEWFIVSDKPFRGFKEVKLVVDTEEEKVVQIRAGLAFNDELDALGEYDRSIEVFKRKYLGEWKTVKQNGHREGIYSSCKLPDDMSVDVNVVPYYDYSVVLLMMTDDERLGRGRRNEIKHDMESLK